ncbi:FAS1 domain-containing protein [Apodospora peruviana]|uniref:FAS1 domain-containing protein n=1 Tax=Apodospora peruviana TaxID=516989 RepID=A0AAE0HUE2_9PEZI|nr:FAS1 domain-containing protein [Apodospora peruviana]
MARFSLPAACRLPSTLLVALLAFSSVTSAASDLDSVDLHNLDSVLADSMEDMSAFRDLVTRYPDIYGRLKDVTILAPNDRAFSMSDHSWIRNQGQVEATLRYHILPGRYNTNDLPMGVSAYHATTLDDSAFSNLTKGQRVFFTKQPDGKVVVTSGFGTRGTLTKENLPFSGGLVQIVDGLMKVPEPIGPTIGKGFPHLSAFLGALHHAGLVDELSDMKDVTVFAPRNTAFQQMSHILEGMTTKELKRVMSYHIVPGTVKMSWELQNASILDAIESTDEVNQIVGRRKLHVTRFNNYIYINSAQVDQANLLLSNGVMYSIDNVLSPNNSDARPDVAISSQPPVLGPSPTNKVSDSSIPFTTYVPELNFTRVDADYPSVTTVTTTMTENVAAMRCTGLGLALIGALAVGL